MDKPKKIEGRLARVISAFLATVADAEALGVISKEDQARLEAETQALVQALGEPNEQAFMERRSAVLEVAATRIARV
jgi:hypothetical protein